MSLHFFDLLTELLDLFKFTILDEMYEVNALKAAQLLLALLGVHGIDLGADCSKDVESNSAVLTTIER